jgi:hypothetical protein
VATPAIVCGQYSQMLVEFVTNVYNLGFSELPNYSKLKSILMQVMVANDLPFDNIFDWSTKTS